MEQKAPYAPASSTRSSHSSPLDAGSALPRSGPGRPDGSGDPDLGLSGSSRDGRGEGRPKRPMSELVRLLESLLEKLAVLITGVVLCMLWTGDRGGVLRAVGASCP